jgi:acetylornithine/succinyldiaminopimelate/putrescine aminotransferase
MKHFARDHGVAVNKQVVVGFDNSNHGNTVGTLSFSSKDANP